MRTVRSTLACVVLLTVAVAPGCGGDDGAGPAASVSTTAAAAQPFVDRDEIFGLLRASGLRIQRTPGTGVDVRRIDPRPLTTTRYTEKSGVRFELLAFQTPAQARAALPSVRAGRTVESAAEGVNLVAAFAPGAVAEVRHRVEGVLRDLAKACDSDDGDPDLRRICFGGDAARTG